MTGATAWGASPQSYTGLSASTTYYAQCQGTNARGSTTGSTASATTLSALGMVGNWGQYNITQTGFSMTWSRPLSGTPTSYGWQVLYNGAVIKSGTAATVATGNPSVAVTGLQCGHAPAPSHGTPGYPNLAYQVFVWAIDASGAGPKLEAWASTLAC